MLNQQDFLPEALLQRQNAAFPTLRAAAGSDTIFTGRALRCTAGHDLIVSCGGYPATMPRREAVAPEISGAEREIAVISCVGKEICFTVESVTSDGRGEPVILLSRRRAQQLALAALAETLTPGTILRAVVTHVEPFGAFVDIGCGIISLLTVDCLSVSRIPHPKERLRVGQHIYAVVTGYDAARKRFRLSHKELLGTWLENASLFRTGETVPGIVRGVREYGIFVELTPNLCALAEFQPEIRAGERAAVFIKSIQPEKMKIKLQIVQTLPEDAPVPPLQYQLTGGTLARWVYSPPDYLGAPVETVFTPCP